MNASGYLKKEMRNAAVPLWHPLIDMHWAWHIHPLYVLPHTHPRTHTLQETTVEFRLSLQGRLKILIIISLANTAVLAKNNTLHC